MNSNLATIAIMFVIFSLSGCTNNEQRIAELENQIEVLRNRLDSLLVECESLNLELKSLKSDQRFKELLRNLDEMAYLTPGDEGYSTVMTNLGTITISLKDIKPYANGSRVTLQFGNTLNATLIDLKAKIEWGKLDSEGSPENETQKSKEITLTKSLAPGRWTNVSVVLNGTPPIDLGFIRIKELRSTGISLLQE